MHKMTILFSSNVLDNAMKRFSGEMRLQINDNNIDGYLKVLVKGNRREREGAGEGEREREN